MKKRVHIKNWFSALLIFIISLISMSFTIVENYNSHFRRLPDCSISISTDSVCNLLPINYRAYPAGLNVKNRDSISRIDLLKATKLESEDKRFEIISFRVGIGDDCFHHGLYTEIPCDKNIISDKAKELIKIYETGGPIFFECIAARTKAGKIFRLKSVTYWLKD